MITFLNFGHGNFKLIFSLRYRDQNGQIVINLRDRKACAKLLRRFREAQSWVKNHATTKLPKYSLRWIARLNSTLHGLTKKNHVIKIKIHSPRKRTFTKYKKPYTIKRTERNK